MEMKPKKTQVPLPISLTEEQWNRLEAEAERFDVGPLGDYISMILAEWFKAEATDEIDTLLMRAMLYRRDRDELERRRG